MGGGRGRDPTFFLGQTEARRAKKNYKGLDIGTELPHEKKKKCTSLGSTAKAGGVL